MSRYHFYHSKPHFPCGGSARSGLTLVEILIAVSLMTIIMLAVVRILSHVSGELNKAQGAMVMAGRARTAQLQIERDLGCVTAPLTPPLRFADAQGYFCIIEGQGGFYRNLKTKAINEDTNSIVDISPSGWLTKDIAINLENEEPDSTIGDCDDIIMFTARAPGDSMFRGFFGRDSSGKIEVRESKEAEICYFLRGTTLYRRVLLIVPDAELQTKLDTPYYSNSAWYGYGFYRDFDVSVHLDENGVIHANTLADLTRRENRYGHSNLGRNGNDSYLTTINNSTGVTYLPFPYGIHNNAAWYQLRLPTLAECTQGSNTLFWRAGAQIVTDENANAANVYRKLVSDMTYDGGSPWAGEVDCEQFPLVPIMQDGKPVSRPYLDLWTNPYPWKALDAMTGAMIPDNVSNVYATAAQDDFHFSQRENEDVLLTNVISFNVQVWDTESKEFIDLGQYRYHNNLNGHVPSNLVEARETSQYLGSQGFYGTNDASSCYSDDGTIRYGLLPAVYDTWTDAYENDATNSVLGTNDQVIPGIGVTGDGIADVMEHVDQWRCPPPYTVPLSGIQIKIRVFDAHTNNIREVTIRRNFK